MKHRTNQQRVARKERKLTELQAAIATRPKQIHTTYHSNPGYAEIMGQVRLKTSIQTIRPAHPGRDIARIQLFPKILWSSGTYIKSEHGLLKTS